MNKIIKTRSPSIDEVSEALLDFSLLVVVPKKPYFEWSLTTFPELSKEDNIPAPDDPEAYTTWMIPSIDLFPDQDAFDAFLKDIKPGLFEEELAGWCQDERVWPTSRTPELFDKWFTLRRHDIVRSIEEIIEMD